MQYLTVATNRIPFLLHSLRWTQKRTVGLVGEEGGFVYGKTGLELRVENACRRGILGVRG